MPETLSSRDVHALRRLVPAEEQQDDSLADPREVDPISRSKRQPRLPDASADALVIAEVTELKSEHPSLNSRSHGHIESSEPVAKGVPAVIGQVLSNRQHESAIAKLSYLIIIINSAYAEAGCTAREVAEGNYNDKSRFVAGS